MAGNDLTGEIMDKSRHTRTSSRISLSIGSVLLVTIIVICTFFLITQYEEKFSRVREQNMFIARLVAYHTIDTMNSIHQVLNTIHNALELTLDDKHSDHAAHDYIIESLLEQSRKFSPFITNLVISDATGTPLHWLGKAKPYEIMDEDYIRKHVRKVQETDLYISGILSGDKDNTKPFFGFSVGFRDNTGRLQYIYTALIDYDFFTEDFAKLGIPEGTTIALGSSNGHILMRLPRPTFLLKDHAPLVRLWNSNRTQGTASLVSPFDNIRRETVFTRVGNYPFMAFASTSDKVILKEWKIYFWTMLSGGVLLLLFFGHAYYIFFRHQRQAILYQNLLEEQAMLDPLTRLPNRRRFFPIMEREFGLARRHSRTLALLLIDIDHFKRINDRHGHERGDVVLVKVAETLSRVCRSTDISCRMGGEEFAVLLSNTGIDGAMTTAEKIRTAIEGLTVETEGLKLKVTVSIGISCYEYGDEKTKDMMIRSDAALYKAKHIGRNTVFALKRHETMDL